MQAGACVAVVGCVFEGADLVAGVDTRAAFEVGPHRGVGGAQLAVVDAHGGGTGDAPGERHVSPPGSQHGFTGVGGEVDPTVSGQPPLLRRREVPDDPGFSGEWPAPPAFVGQGGRRVRREGELCGDQRDQDGQRTAGWNTRDRGEARGAPRGTLIHAFEHARMREWATTRIACLWTTELNEGCGGW